jgi:hypothetical protein
MNRPGETSTGANGKLQADSDLIIQFFHPEGMLPSRDVSSFFGVFKNGNGRLWKHLPLGQGRLFSQQRLVVAPALAVLRDGRCGHHPPGNHGHSNVGWGLDDDGATALAERLELALRSGYTHRYAELYHQRIRSLPYQPCAVCGATGHRAEPPAIGPGPLLCNACDGKGEVPDFETHYPFDEDNFCEFAGLLRLCGGFRIC